jgi:hypothetical protein
MYSSSSFEQPAEIRKTGDVCFIEIFIDLDRFVLEVLSACAHAIQVRILLPTLAETRLAICLACFVLFLKAKTKINIKLTHPSKVKLEWIKQKSCFWKQKQF